jgi:DNA-binding transcriptional regulator YhcF (GntR family)
MTNGEFREWLKGFFELSEEDVVLDMKQLQVIVNHLNLAEAVEGKLDAANDQLRGHIRAFRDRGVTDADALNDLTQLLRTHILTG